MSVVGRRGICYTYGGGHCVGTARQRGGAPGLRLTKVHRRLAAQGVAVSYSTLYRFARRHCGFAPEAVTVHVAEPPPGELAEINFGMLRGWVDPGAVGIGDLPCEGCLQQAGPEHFLSAHREGLPCLHGVTFL